jgi:cyclopropane-fatty-acyl-phospholipid synthase
MAETWLQSAARNSVFEVLKRLQHGCLTITTKYISGKGQSVTFGNSDSESDLGIVVVIKNPQVYVRFCQGFDLVRIQRLYRW